MAHFIRSEVLEQCESSALVHHGSGSDYRLSVYPIMIGDVSQIIRTWGKEGVLDPFANVYQVVFALSMRLGTCNEFCDDPEKVEALMRIFADLEAGSKPTSVILPWMPTPSRLRRTFAGAKLYRMISVVVEKRKREERREDDPLQVLIDKKFSLVEITRFIAMTLFAAVTNTGNVFCWVLIYLEVHQKWKTAVQNEIAELIRINRSSRGSEDIGEVLARAGMTGLDEATPILGQCIDEVLRMIFSGTFMRRNIGPDLTVDGTCISQGTFLMFPTGDLHFDETLFPDPYMFDPTRFSADGIEARKEKGINFLGWGAARHVCVGKRAAMMMMKTIVALMMGTFEIEVVGENGVRLEAAPRMRQDMLFKVCPSAEKVRLKYQLI
ncbi:hypothetical protein HYDPIDRAFT_101775 [Hydnomerulius pinastri MD-312]|uniref:Cytochrome P450 n=1 Tax=Hydnomerulius pinastri MD-312 TaxID=994086 RepID=A0A0C9VML8_9AGAM|nr:hypothetical protein HYDPIDRAFT_101775 [Hydnomerulius pinastri MD-312]